MISVIVGTSREESKSSLIGKYYESRLKEISDEEIMLYSLEDLKSPFLLDNKYKPESQSDQLKEVQDKYFIGADRWVIIVPEYNGGIPGVFKHMLDAMSIREYGATFGNKKVALVGVSAGKAGNLRGLDYLMNLLSYVKSNVFRNKLPISQIESLVEQNELVNKETKHAIESHIEEFLLF